MLPSTVPGGSGVFLVFQVGVMREKIVVFLLATVVDLIFGELPNILHPVYYMGRIGMLLDGKRNPKNSNIRNFLLGLLVLCFELLMWVLLCLLVLRIKILPLRLTLSVFLFKACFSIRGLYSHVKRTLTEDITQLRKAVSMIVSRDTKNLDKPHLYSAALESLSENISDSITGPWFYYLFFGLAGAVFYRVTNTFDALFGYRTQRYEWFGKAAARLDDFLNFIPARFTALVISLFNPKRAFRYLKKYGGIKINATYPMSTFAGVLGVGFEKIGYYKFEGDLPNISDIKRGLNLYVRVVFVLFTIFFLLLLGLKV